MRPYCISGNRLLIKDLRRFSPLQSLHYIPLFEMESTGLFRTLADGSCGRSTRETLRSGPSSGLASCRCSRSEISGWAYPPALPLSASKAICGPLFFEPASVSEAVRSGWTGSLMESLGLDQDEIRGTLQHLGDDGVPGVSRASLDGDGEAFEVGWGGCRCLLGSELPSHHLSAWPGSIRGWVRGAGP